MWACSPVLSRRVPCAAGGGKVSVAKVQVGLLGSARTLKRDLDRIAGRADTNSPEGLHYVMQGELPGLPAGLPGTTLLQLLQALQACPAEHQASIGNMAALRRFVPQIRCC